MRVLVLEDDAELGEMMADALRQRGYAVDHVTTLREARAVHPGDYDVAVLDRSVPDGDGLSLLAHWRAQDRVVNTLVVSGVAGDCDRVEGLEAGALDYVAKPLQLVELGLRVDALARRPAAPEVALPAVLGDVRVDLALREVTMAGRPVRLSRLQYAVFEYLVVNRDRMVSSGELLDHCWDRHRDLFTNPLPTQIARLRVIFEGRLGFECVRGEGYRIVVP